MARARCCIRNRCGAPSGPADPAGLRSPFPPVGSGGEGALAHRPKRVSQATSQPLCCAAVVGGTRLERRSPG